MSNESADVASARPDMAAAQPEILSTGEMIRGAFAVLRDNARPVLIYLAVMIAAGVLGDMLPYYGIGDILSLAQVPLFFVAQYLLFEAMLRNANMLAPDARRRVFGFVGQALVVTLGVTIAVYLLVIPAFIVGARWIAAPSLLVSGRCGPVKALGESWAETKGNTAQIAFASIALMLMAYVVVMVIDGAGGVVAMAFGGSQKFGEAALIGPNLALVCLSVAVYRRLNDDTRELAEVFA
jgi:hypothetical protein